MLINQVSQRVADTMMHNGIKGFIYIAEEVCRQSLNKNTGRLDCLIRIGSGQKKIKNLGVNNCEV